MLFKIKLVRNTLLPHSDGPVIIPLTGPVIMIWIKNLLRIEVVIVFSHLIKRITLIQI